jgi:hypothetical protein
VSFAGVVEKSDLVTLLLDALSAAKAQLEARYDLVANVVHDRKPEDGTYRVHVLHKVLVRSFFSVSLPFHGHHSPLPHLASPHAGWVVRAGDANLVRDAGPARVDDRDDAAARRALADAHPSVRTKRRQRRRRRRCRACNRNRCHSLLVLVNVLLLFFVFFVLGFFVIVKKRKKGKKTIWGFATKNVALVFVIDKLYLSSLIGRVGPGH